jgi:protein TonB
MATVQDRAFGNRYAYYVKIVSQIVAQNWYTQEADAAVSQGKRVTILFDINRDGVPQNIRIETKSGSPSLDASALHALQRVDNFGPLPAGDHITVEYSFDYKQQ